MSAETYHDIDTSRPMKRQRIDRDPSPEMADGDISSDTDGSVPGTPTHSSVSYLHGGMPDAEDNIPLEQITQCKWEGCLTGDCGNMDKLVDHLHDQHIHARQKKYACEWQDCARKGIPHASGYALRAHMRSHTREKPFYCSLPGKQLITQQQQQYSLTQPCRVRPFLHTLRRSCKTHAHCA